MFFIARQLLPILPLGSFHFLQRHRTRLALQTVFASVGSKRLRRMPALAHIMVHPPTFIRLDLCAAYHILTLCSWLYACANKRLLLHKLVRALG